MDLQVFRLRWNPPYDLKLGTLQRHTECFPELRDRVSAAKLHGYTLNFRAQPEFRVRLVTSAPADASQAGVIKDSPRTSALSRAIHLTRSFGGLGFGHFSPARNSMVASFESRKPQTIIEARVELGPSHGLFVRGEGAGLSWCKGTALLQVDPNTWIWVDDSPAGALIFQLLLDDQIWARGENLALEAGRKIELTPDFEWPEIPRTC